MMKILQDMRAEQMFLRKKAPNPNPHATFKVKVPHSADCNEFKRQLKKCVKKIPYNSTF